MTRVVRAAVHWAIVENALGEAARKAFEMLPETEIQRFLSESQRRSFAAGFAEGFAKGFAEGFAKGKAKGNAEAVLQVLARRALTVTEGERQRILGCRDLDTLVRWLDRALTITTIDELFA